MPSHPGGSSEAHMPELCKGNWKRDKPYYQIIINTTGFRKQSQDSDHLHLLKNFKHHFQHDLLQKHALGCKTENAPDLVFFWGGGKCSLDNQFFLKYNVCVCCYLVSASEWYATFRPIRKNYATVLLQWDILSKYAEQLGLWLFGST